MEQFRKNYQAIIFDMDGTIIDTEVIWQQATQDVIEKRGIIYTPEIHTELEKHIHGLALHKSCAFIKDMFQFEESLEVLMQEKGQRAIDLYKVKVRFIEGFETFIKQVHAEKLKTAIATNADNETVAATNEKLALQNYFGRHIYTVNHVDFICKPHPALYLHAAGQLEVDPIHCLAIEDSAHGIKAAKAAGMTCVGINTSKNPSFLKESDFIINAYSELDLKRLLKKD